MEIKFIIIIGVILLVCGSIFIYLNSTNDDSQTNGEILKDTNSTHDINIIFLHHSTGSNIWNGGVEEWFDSYNKDFDTNYSIIEQSFPKSNPYGWKNYPYDYWNIWVNHAGNEPYMEEPTLEMITETYDIVIWKHCYPVSNIGPDTGNPMIDSEEKRLEIYKIQYNALKEKMKGFPNTSFILWTIAALTESSTNEEKAQRAQEFYQWVKEEWDESGDNIFLWDFYILETEGGLYLKSDYAEGTSDSHPNSEFSKTVAPYFCQRIIDIINGNGDKSDITGKQR